MTKFNDWQNKYDISQEAFDELSKLIMEELHAIDIIEAVRTAVNETLDDMKNEIEGEQDKY